MNTSTLSNPTPRRPHDALTASAGWRPRSRASLAARSLRLAERETDPVKRREAFASHYREYAPR